LRKVIAALLLPLFLFWAVPVGAYSGNSGVWAMKSGDFVARNFAGTRAGIQAAIDYLGTTGGVVQVGAGTFTIDETIHIYSDDVKLVGSGMSATTFNCTSGDTALAVMPSTGIKTNGWHLEGFTLKVGAAYTGPLLYLNGGDFYWSMRGVKVLQPSSGYDADIAVQFMNCQNGIVDNIWVRSEDLSHVFQIGVDIDINDANNRGNLTFLGGVISNAKIGVAGCRSLPANAVNNINFFGTKFVNSVTIVKDNTKAAVLTGQADEWGFFNCHFESFQTAIEDSLADHTQVIGGIFSKIKNDAGSAGTCFNITAAEGVFISPPRINDVFDVVVLNGNTRETVYHEGRQASVAGAAYTDNSTGKRDRNIANRTVGNFFGYTGVIPDTLRVMGDAALIAGGTAGFAAADAHSTTFSIDGGATGTQTLNFKRNSQIDLQLFLQGSTQSKFRWRTPMEFGSPTGTSFGKWLNTGEFRVGDANTPTHGFEVAAAATVGDSLRVGKNLTLGFTVFANLGTPANGTVIYCNDCTKATPTASGGTGALVVRINGAWDGNP
jgi:hypothetical protein